MDSDSQTESIEMRLSRLEAKDAIAELLVRYGEVVDNQDAEGLRNLLTADARWAWASGGVEANGIDEVMDTLASRWAMIDTSLHVVQGHYISLDEADPDLATGVVFSHAEVVLDAQPMIAAVRYDDTYRRSAGGSWRFAERVLSFYYYVEANAYVEQLASGRPVRLSATPWPADFPTLPK